MLRATVTTVLELVKNFPHKNNLFPQKPMSEHRSRMPDRQPPPPSIALSASLSFLLSKKVLLGWSLLLVLLTVALTWLGFQLTTGALDSLTGSFFEAAPMRDSWWYWIKYPGWLAGKYLFILVSRIIAFFLAFLLAYTLTTPLYGFLSNAAEKLYWGEQFDEDDGFTLAGIAKDLFEGLKIALFGLVVTVIALLIGFVPVIGQISVFLIYTYYSTLMFIDYPASRRRWGLGRKLSWLRNHAGHSFRLGLVPAAIGMLPVLNIFLMALIFPLFTIHAALNFSTVEKHRR
jgi:CysZ protein